MAMPYVDTARRNMEIEPVPVKTVWSVADWMVLFLFLAPLAVILWVYDLFARLLKLCLKRGGDVHV